MLGFYMSLQARLLGKFIVTMFAVEWFLSCVLLGMSWQSTRVMSLVRAFITFVLVNGMILFGMVFQFCEFVKIFPALVTAK